MSKFNVQRLSTTAGCAGGGGALLAGGAADEQPAPRVVTTGRKVTTPVAVDVETGEPVQLVAAGLHGVSAIRHLTPDATNSPACALVDALAFTVVPPGDWSYVWVLEQMRQFMEIDSVEMRRGLFGFKYSARFGDGAGMVAWGGESQRGRVYFSIMGQGCSMIKDWSALASWLEENRAVIKRADVAYDDFDGRQVSIAWAVDQYKGDGFNAGGRKPIHSCYGDWLEGESASKGRTLGIGNRASGKYARIYEKGKQLGDAASAWTRVEVEWRAQDRHIPYDLLTRPGHYLAGAYPCLAFLDEEQSSIKTVSKAAQVAYDTAVAHAKQHCGKLINLMLAVLGGDFSEVVGQLSRPGIPARIDPYSYHVRQNPIMLDRQMSGVLV